MTPAPAATREPTMLAVAIAKIDAAALVLALAVPDEPEPDVTLFYAAWHQILNDLAGARAALRTQQIINRREGAA
jgi:hypothetical protein